MENTITTQSPQNARRMDTMGTGRSGLSIDPASLSCGERGARMFLFLERLCKTVASPGGRILLLLVVTVAFYMAALLNVREAVWPGGLCLLTFLKLTRNPRNAPGMLRRVARRTTTT